MTSLIQSKNNNLFLISDWNSYVPLSYKKIQKIIFDLNYYKYNVPEPMLMKMPIGKILFRYTQLMEKVREDRKNEDKILEFLAKHTCPFLGKK